MKYTLKNLRAQCDEKAEELRTFNLYEEIRKLFEKNTELRLLANKYLREFTKPEDERRILEDIERLMQDEIKLTDEIKIFLRIPLTKKKKVVS